MSNIHLWLYDKLIENYRPAIEDLMKVQEYILFLMVTLRPPMRTQNLELTVLAKLESPIEAKSNGIVSNWVLFGVRGR